MGKTTMSSPGYIYALVVLGLVLFVNADSDSYDIVVGQSPSALVSPYTDEEKTTGILGAITPFLRPFTAILYEYWDSILRNVYNEALPCTLYSITPWKMVCSPVPS